MFDRGERLKELYKEVVNDLLREMKDPGLSGFLTVTGTELSADRKSLAVYYSILGTEAQREAAARALERAGAFLREKLKKRVRVKVVPALRFVYDETPRRASRIDELLNKLERERESP